MQKIQKSSFKILLQYPAYKEGFKFIDWVLSTTDLSSLPPNLQTFIKLYKFLKTLGSLVSNYVI